MCNFLSGYATKKEIKIDPFVDSHENQIEINGDQHLDKDGNLVRFEIEPNFKDFFNAQSWEFKRDQDIIPDWADLKEIEISAKTKLQEILDSCPQNEEISIISNRVLAIGKCTVSKMTDFAIVRFMFNSQVNKMFNKAKIINDYRS